MCGIATLRQRATGTLIDALVPSPSMARHERAAAVCFRDAFHEREPEPDPRGAGDADAMVDDLEDDFASFEPRGEPRAARVSRRRAPRVPRASRSSSVIGDQRQLSRGGPHRWLTRE